MSAHLLSTGIYVPEKKMPVAELVPSDWADDYVNNVIGIDTIPIASPEEHASDMAIKASLNALTSKNLNPQDIDVVIYCGLGVNDYGFWSPSAKIQYEIGATNAYAFDLYQGCANSVLALKMARDFLIANPQMNYILIAASSRSGEWVEGRNSGTSFYSDGGAAAIVSRGGSDWVIGDAVSLTNGYFQDIFYAKSGGTVQPPYSDSEDTLFKVRNKEKQRIDLKPVFAENYVKTILHLAESVDGPLYVNTINLNKNLLNTLQERLGDRVQGWLNNVREYGHMGPCDPILNFHLAEQNNPLPKGAVLINVISGIGMSWSACRLERTGK